MVKPASSQSAPRRSSAAIGLPPAATAPALAPRGGAAPLEPSMMVLPYLELSRAMLRAHHDAVAMMEANRALADSLRGIVRRQQDLAFEIAEQAMGRPDGASPEDRAGMFRRAAEAVRELGEAMIRAQLSALDTLQDRVRATAATEAEGSTRH